MNHRFLCWKGRPCQLPCDWLRQSHCSSPIGVTSYCLFLSLVQAQRLICQLSCPVRVARQWLIFQGCCRCSWWPWFHLCLYLWPHNCSTPSRSPPKTSRRCCLCPTGLSVNAQKMWLTAVRCEKWTPSSPRLQILCVDHGYDVASSGLLYHLQLLQLVLVVEVKHGLVVTLVRPVALEVRVLLKG